MKSESGQAAIEFAMAIAVLLLPVALVVVSFGPWLERRVSAEAAAAEGARAAVLSLDLSAGNDAALHTANRPTGEVRIGWCGTSPAVVPSGSCALSRGAAIEVEVEIWTPFFNTPWGSVGGLWVSGHHAEPIDLYRSLG